jgi:hypothetical protein
MLWKNQANNFIISYSLYKALFTIILYFYSAVIYSQTCGFNCIGITGIYGGYSIQKYKSEALRNYVTIFKYDTVKTDNSERISFGTASGFKFGVNIFRARFNKIYFGAKTHYQFLKEEKKYKYELSGFSYDDKYEIWLNYFAFALDFGIPLFSFLEFKAFESGLTLNTAELHNSIYENGKIQKIEKYSNSARSLNYYLSSGLILKLYKDVLQLEGTVSYNSIKIGLMEDEEGNNLADKKNGELFEKTIDKGGLSLNAQINLSVTF